MSRIQRSLLRLLAAAMGVAAASLVSGQQAAQEHLIDIGEEGDEGFVGEGIYGAENPGKASPFHDFYRNCSFRWFANEWSLRLPVFAGRDNEITFRARLQRDMHLSFGPGFEAKLQGAGDEGYEYPVIVPAEAVGEYERLEVRGRAEPPYVMEEGRDRRELAWTVDWVKIRPVDEAPAGVPVATASGPIERAPEHFVNIGVEGDEGAIVSGGYQREGYNPRSRHAFFRWCSFRWFQNEWALKLPVFAGRHNEIAVRALTGRMLRLSVPGVLEGAFVRPGGSDYQARIVLPAEELGERESIELHGLAVPPIVPGPEAQDKRELAVAIDWVRVRPLDEVPESIMAIQQLPEEKEPDLPLPFRLRGTEMRPLYTDIESYVLQARLMRCNVMTIGPMNGRHFTAFESRHGTPAPNMQPDFIPDQIKALHQWGIAAIGWLPFNVQDMRATTECEAAKKHPEWTMKFLEWEERPSENKVGMCVVSSPWRERHAEILTEAAALGLDGVFFDGFYLGGIPHPTAPGCVCQWCRERFTRETGVETPARVDWTDGNFKRWVRWRNEKLIETAIYFRDRMREANPELQVTCNYNIWPFGNKDWDTAIPMWSTDQFGVSQHAYSGRHDLEWVMLGFKSRVSHDLNPQHSDIWRTSRPAWNYDDTEADRARHELTMRTFMLSGLAHGTTPWHGGHIQPAEVGVRIHEAVRERERFFSQDEVRHLGVVLSQNTHDFYGHIPDTDNLAEYRDTILGAWLLLAEQHVPFRFVFDNEIEGGELGDYAAVLMPNTACLSDEMAGRLGEYVQGGGRLIVTGETGAYDEWGEQRQQNALAGIEGVVRLEGAPLLEWLRSRDQGAEQAVLDAVSAAPAPLVVEAPRWLATNACWAPGRREVWLHMLNVSAFYPLGDTGFRGMGQEPVYAGEVASDAQIMEGGKIKRTNVPVREVVVRVPGFAVRSARLGVAGTPIQPDAEGRLVVPEVDVHEVLVLELE